jgi:hypothetical protein
MSITQPPNSTACARHYKYVSILKKCLITSVLLAAWFPLCGCGRTEQEALLAGKVTQVQQAGILSLRKGFTRNEVEVTLGGPGQFQFSARLATGDYLCVSYAFERHYVYYYFLFRGEILEKILAPPAFGVDLVPYEDFPREIEKPCSAESRVSILLQTSELSPAELLVALNKALSRRTETFNVLPALIAAGPALAKNAKPRRLDYEKNAALAEQFDPAKTKLGDTEDGLVPRYGPPLSLATNGATHVYQFGSKIELNINPAYQFSGVSVVAEDGLVTRVFCHDFFCDPSLGLSVNKFDDPTKPNYFCSVHGVFFDNPKSPHMNH